LAKGLLIHFAMDRKTQTRLEARARILKALAHPSRLFIVEELSRGERCVFELTEMVGSDMSTVSKHLSVLRSAGIIAHEKRGSQVYYQLKMPCATRFFECVGEALQHAAKQRWDLVCSDK
jgi:DNA-binding transcriptional ArsR family regulator